jgi:hypothetical protein
MVLSKILMCVKFNQIKKDISLSYGSENEYTRESLEHCSEPLVRSFAFFILTPLFINRTELSSIEVLY